MINSKYLTFMMGVLVIFIILLLSFCGNELNSSKTRLGNTVIQLPDIIPDNDDISTPIASVLSKIDTNLNVNSEPTQYLAIDKTINSSVIDNISVARAAIKNVSPFVYKISTDIERIKGDLSDDDFIYLIKTGDDFYFRLALHSICPVCYESVLFYETNMHGSLLSNEEYSAFMNTDIYGEIYNNKLIEMCTKIEHSKLLDCVKRQDTLNGRKYNI